jgi:hypothetical protein
LLRFGIVLLIFLIARALLACSAESSSSSTTTITTITTISSSTSRLFNVEGSGSGCSSKLFLALLLSELACYIAMTKASFGWTLEDLLCHVERIDWIVRSFALDSDEHYWGGCRGNSDSAIPLSLNKN